LYAFFRWWRGVLTMNVYGNDICRTGKTNTVPMQILSWRLLPFSIWWRMLMFTFFLKTCTLLQAPLKHRSPYPSILYSLMIQRIMLNVYFFFLKRPRYLNWEHKITSEKCQQIRPPYSVILHLSSLSSYS
jgi:hypothetical protein